MKKEEDVDSECWAQVAEKWYARHVSLGRVNRHKFLSRHSRVSGKLGLDTLPSLIPSLIHSALPMSSDLLLPGQPVPLPRGAMPQVGSGIYSRDGTLRASLIGVPSHSGSVCLFSALSCLESF